MIVNAHRDPRKGRSARVDDFSPYKSEAREVIRVDKNNIGELKEAFAGFGKVKLEKRTWKQSSPS